MSMQRQGESGRLALVAAIIIAVVMGAFIVVNELVVTSAAEPDAEMILKGEGGTTGDCAEGLAYCVETGAKFALTVEITNAPDAGYIFAGAWVNYGDHLTYNPVDPPSDEVIWPDCLGVTVLRSQSVDGTKFHVLLGCLSGLIPPLVASEYEGDFWELSMTCSSGNSSTIVRLLPEGDEIAGTSGALFKDPSNNSVVPKVSNLLVHCGTGGPLATDTPTHTPTHTPGPTATPTSSGSINGTVTDRDGGAPLEAVCVTVFNSSFSLLGSAVTDSNGDYSVTGFLTGDYKVRFNDCVAGAYLGEWYDDEPDFLSADFVHVIEPLKTAGIDAALTLGGQINGTVTDENTGDLLQGIRVTVSDSSFSSIGSTTTASDGTYTIVGLPTGDYRVQFRDFDFPTTYLTEWYDDQPDSASADLVHVTEKVKTSGIDAALTLGGSISGTVTGENTGDPLALVCVNVYDSSFSFLGFGFTNSNGGYSVTGLPTGNHKVEFSDCVTAVYVTKWYNEQPNFDAADPVSVTEELKTTSIDAALAFGAEINGTVTNENTGDPLPDICAIVYDSSFSFLDFDVTASDGSYTVIGLPTGDYKIEFRDCGTGAHLTEWYEDQPDFDSADPVSVTEKVKTSFIDAALSLASSITICKATDPATGGILFDFDGDLGDIDLLHGACQLFTRLDHGAYSVTENEAPGWNLTAIVCTGTPATNIAVDLAAETVTVNLKPGTDVTCTFTNTRKPTDTPTNTPTATNTPTNTPTPTPTPASAGLGQMTGGGDILTASADRVSHGFTLHCAPADEPNSLEVNWAGNVFHLEQLQIAICLDNPDTSPNPPTADFDTYIGSGTGRLNGGSGATAEWTFTDNGQPGRSDLMEIVVKDASGNTVLDVAGNLAGGNHQAHGPSGPPRDTDADGCHDLAELGAKPAQGGQRDPLNPWDFYDTNSDGVVDLPNDILGVILAFGAYDVVYDRGPSAGSNPWNMTAPDGVIDLPNDILGVILQFGHSCV